MRNRRLCVESSRPPRRAQKLAGRLSDVVNLFGPNDEGISRGEILALPQVFQLLRRCRAYIGNDSGITHLAAYLGCPTVAIFGPTDPRVWGPIGRRSRVIWKAKLEDISVEEVLLALPCKPPRHR